MTSDAPTNVGKCFTLNIASERYTKYSVLWLAESLYVITRHVVILNSPENGVSICQLKQLSVHLSDYVKANSRIFNVRVHVYYVGILHGFRINLKRSSNAHFAKKRYAYPGTISLTLPLYSVLYYNLFGEARWPCHHVYSHTPFSYIYHWEVVLYY